MKNCELCRENCAETLGTYVDGKFYDACELCWSQYDARRTCERCAMRLPVEMFDGDVWVCDECVCCHRSL